jgi:putative drug exporter of the RND superfamily
VIIVDKLLYRVGRVSAQHPWRVVAAWLAAVAGAFALATAIGGEPVNDYRLPDAPSQAGFDLLEEHLPELAGAKASVVVRAGSGELDPAALTRLGAELAGVPHVSSVAAPRLAADGDAALLAVGYDVPVTHEEVMGNPEALEDAVDRASLGDAEVAYGGEVPESALEVGGTGEVAGVVAAFVLLVLTFGSLLAAGLPLVVALLGLGLGSAAGMLLMALTDISGFAPTVATMVGLGVGIDYALLLLTRFVEHRAEGLDPVEAAARANVTAGRAVVFAGTTVLVSLFGLRFGGLPIFESFGTATALTVIAVLAAALTLVPALARLTHRRLDRRTARDPRGDRPALTSRWVTGVVRRPVAWLLASTALLLALAAPALGMRSWPLDPSVDPEDSTTRQAYDLVSAEFGPGATGPLTFVAELTEVRPDQVEAAAAAVAAHDGIVGTTAVLTSPDRSIALFSAESAFAPQDQRTPDLIADLRAEHPDLVVTGYAPMQVDLSNIVSERVWLVALVVIALSVVLLSMMFRSLVVPLKAAAMNLLSIGAAYGVLVSLFQTETGAHLVGLDHAIAVSSFVPIIMFAILFGLSMDYEVFLLSRVREEWLRTGDAVDSVISGIAASTRVISSAAAIMVAVFVGFAFEPTTLIKMLGLGMAVAVALDATLVRMVLAPAAMALLGRAAWWMPGWLDRRLPRISHDATPTDSDRELAAVAR